MLHRIWDAGLVYEVNHANNLVWWLLEGEHADPLGPVGVPMFVAVAMTKSGRCFAYTYEDKAEATRVAEHVGRMHGVAHAGVFANLLAEGDR